MYENVVIGKTACEPWELFALDEKDWEENEKKKTLFTQTRWLPVIMKEAGLVKSNNEVRKNRPELCVTLDKRDFIELKWGKRFLFIAVGE